MTPKLSWSKTAREIKNRIRFIKEEHPLGIDEKDCYRSDRGMSKEETARWDKEVIAHLEEKKKKCADRNIEVSSRDEKRLSALIETVKRREKNAAEERRRSLNRYLKEEQITLAALNEKTLNAKALNEKTARKAPPKPSKKSSAAKK